MEDRSYSLQRRYSADLSFDGSTGLDRDRVLLSAEFSRLAEITQVVPANHGRSFHNRLTHSLKVAQVARLICAKLIRDAARDSATAILLKDGALDHDACEAAALAHDLGHPPFGHTAESELDLCARECGLLDGFEGNAQSFRIVTSLAKINYQAPKIAFVAALQDNGVFEGEGLNLTRRTLNGILKYPWLHRDADKVGRPDKWGAYEDEADAFLWVREDFPYPFKKSLEAEIMDWADDVAFALHDMSDFYRAGRIPLDRLSFPRGVKNGGEFEAWWDDIKRRHPGDPSRTERYGEALREVLDMFPIDKVFRGELSQTGRFDDFLQILVPRYVAAISVVDPQKNDGRGVIIDRLLHDEVSALKELTQTYIIHSQDLAAVRFGQRRIVRRVFRTLHQIAIEKIDNLKHQRRVFPAAVGQRLSACNTEAQTTRVVLDYVAGMTEGEIVSIHRTLCNSH